MIIRLVAGLSLAFLLFTGCASGPVGTGASSPGYNDGYPSLPSAFYDGDPAFRHWYTYPYYNPYEQRR